MQYDNTLLHSKTPYKEDILMTDPFMKVERPEPLSHKVEAQIREAIRQKIFVTGDKLPCEAELSQKFGVSRTAIREALRMLAGRGLVEIRKGSGVYVSEFDMSNVVDPFTMFLDMKCGDHALLHIVRVRLFMEPEIAKLAAIHRTKKDIEYLIEKTKEMDEHAQHPYDNVEPDIKFHRRIARATNNPLIPIIMDPIFQVLPKFISSTYKQSHAPDLAIKYHHQLVDSFQARDADGAYHAMRQHLAYAEKHVLLYYKEKGYEDFDNLTS
jgi:GntR family transcriptional repressor for pyruvate dehydrogenase complex